MNKVSKITMVAALLTLGLMGTATAQQRTSVTRTSPNHTKIVIHNTGASAQKARQERIRRAEERRERERQRAHEIELATIRAGRSESPRRAGDRPKSRQPVNPSLPSIAERQRRQAALNQPAPFFNGGRFTGLVGGFGFAGPGFGPGFVSPGFAPGFVNPGFGFNRTYRPGYRHSFRGPRLRQTRYRGGFRGRGYRGRGCR